MRSVLADGDLRLLRWRRVREFAVPPSMIETATARRMVGDWAGACAAARIDVDLDLRAVARAHGRELAARVRADLRHLAPDLLRWHLPRTAPARPAVMAGRRRPVAGPGRYWSPGRRPPGPTPASGSASRSGTRRPAEPVRAPTGPGCIRMPGRACGSDSICTGICGTCAGS